MTVREILVRIKALVENPHWTADRKNRIGELAQQGIEQIDMLFEKTGLDKLRTKDHNKEVKS